MLTDIKTFLISLERKRDVRGDISFNNLIKYFKNIEIFDAIDGNNLDINNLGNKLQPFIYYQLTTDVNYRVSYLDDYVFIKNKNVIGCALSHISLWEKCIELNEPIIIIEDDVIINSNSESYFKDALENIPKDGDFVSLYSGAILYNNKNKFNIKKDKFLNFNKFNYLEKWWGFQMYYVTPKFCKIILENIYPLIFQIDKAILPIIYKYKIKSYFRTNINKIYALIETTSTIGNGVNISVRKLISFVILLILIITILVFLFIKKQKNNIYNII